MRFVAAVFMLLSVLRADAYYYFTGGPVHDVQANQSWTSIKADLMNVDNLLSQIFGQQTSIQQQFQRARAVIGPAIAGTYEVKSLPDVLANIEPLLTQIAGMRAETEPEKMAQYFAQRQLQVVAQIRTYEARLIELSSHHRRQLTLMERQMLQSEMRALNTQIFATTQQQRADSAAMKAAQTASVDEMRRLREKRERTQKAFGTVDSAAPTK